MAQMTTHPTDAEIAKIEQRARRYAAPAVYNTERLCAAARDRNRLEAENAKLRELAFTDGLTAPDIAKISGMPMDLLEAAVSSEETTFNPDGDRPLSQLETDNG